MSVVLELEGVCVSFGGRHVVQEVSLQVHAGRVVALLGLNGAGKTVTARAVAGLIPLRRGAVRLHGSEITTTAAEARVGLGLRHLPQVGGVVPDLTVAENLRLGGYILRRQTAGYAQALAGVLGRFPLLAERGDIRAGCLSAGQQRILALGRALMAKPQVLIADEPSAGLAPDAVAGLAETIRDLSREGLAILLVEQNISLARSLADEVVVLDRGAVVYRDSAAALDDARLASLLGLGP
ncbi:MAG TPA: ATP-binding cassette domain-containing protein [Acidimicrobiales bacterium]|nr:ATP-binding cassette domain-containing protein [Acidimicrobiales bacterium]